MREPVKFPFGGISRQVAVEIGLAVRIEAETGTGVLALFRQLQALECPLNTAVTILRVALESAGVAYDQDRAIALCAHEGIVDTQVNALRIINGLFVPIDAKKKSTRKSDGPLATATP